MPVLHVAPASVPTASPRPGAASPDLSRADPGTAMSFGSARFPMRWVGTLLGTVVLAAGAVFAAGQVHRITPAEQVALLSDLATHGSVGAQAQLGRAYLDGAYGLHPDRAQALHWLTTAARNGDTYAANWLGDAYAHGDGVAASATAARRWWQRAAEAGDAVAQRKLGAALLHAGDADRARDWLDRAAAQGDPQAHRLLDGMFARHQAGTDDLALGVSGLDRFAAQEGSPAWRALAAGVDLLTAASPESVPDTRTLRQRARDGDPLAETQLGLRYLDGYDDARPDPARAERWLKRAAEAGDVLAARALARLPQTTASADRAISDTGAGTR